MSSWRGFGPATEHVESARTGLLFTVMQDTVSIIALVLSTLSLTWQAATYVLTGGRIRLELRVGALHPSGTGVVTKPVSALREGWADDLAREGFTQTVVAIQITNVGRMPVTVSDWSLITSPGGMSYQPLSDSVGVRLPFRLEAATTETWTTNLDNVYGLAAASTTVSDATVFDIRGRVRLGDGRSRTSTETLRVPAPPDLDRR